MKFFQLIPSGQFGLENVADEFGISGRDFVLLSSIQKLDRENSFAVSKREVIDIKMRQKTDVFFLSYF